MDRDIVISNNRQNLEDEEELEEQEIPAEQVHFMNQLLEEELDLELDLNLNLEIEETNEHKTIDEILNEEFKVKRVPLPKNLRKELVENTTPKFLARSISPKQELFCRYYTSSALKGDGFTSYCKAYGFTPMTKEDYSRAKGNTTKLLNNINISRRINQLLKEEGLSRNDVDVQLGFLIKQNIDLGAKNKAIDTYLKLTGAMKTQVEHTGTVSHKFLFPQNGREPEKLINPASEIVEGEVEASWDELDNIENN